MLGVVNPFKKAGKAYKGAKRVSRIVSKSRVSKKVARSIRKVIKPTRIKRKIRRQKIKTVHAAQRAKCKITKKGCFVAGTKIAVKNGFLPIEKIKAGDRVWSEDMRTGKKTLQKVKKIFVREKDSIVRLSINGEVTETTDEHPFFVKDIGWIPAGQLQLGDEVKLGTDDYAVIDGYEVLSLDEPIKVYNFEVAENHNYYVSKIKVLVHNGYAKRGRFGKQKRLREIANDPKVSKTIRNEMNAFYKQKKRYKVPEGYELAHNKGKEAYKGYGYEHTRLQLKANHRNKHKFYKPWMKKRRKKR